MKKKRIIMILIYFLIITVIISLFFNALSSYTIDYFDSIESKNESNSLEYRLGRTALIN